MAYTSIKPSDLFRAQLYTGNGSARSITYTESTNMQPGLMWIKSRDTLQVGFLMMRLEVQLKD